MACRRPTSLRGLHVRWGVAEWASVSLLSNDRIGPDSPRVTCSKALGAVRGAHPMGQDLQDLHHPLARGPPQRAECSGEGQGPRAESWTGCRTPCVFRRVYVRGPLSLASRGGSQHADPARGAGGFCRDLGGHLLLRTLGIGLSSLSRGGDCFFLSPPAERGWLPQPSLYITASALHFPLPMSN